MSTFVALGNATQPFPRLIAAVSTAFDRLPQPVFVQHGRTPLEDPRLAGEAFLAMDAFVQRIEQARLVVCHAGAGTVLHALWAGKTPVVMPRRARLGELVDDHQAEFAHALARLGRVRLAESAAELSAALAAPGATPEEMPRAPAGRPSRMVDLVAQALRSFAAERP